MPILLETGVDNSGLRAGLRQYETMVDAAVARVSAKMGAAGKGLAAGARFSVAGMTQLGQASTHMERVLNVSGRLNASLDRMSGMFNNALGIGATIGGLMLLEKAFGRSIEKARQFQTAQLAISATLMSGYNIKDAKGQTVTGPQAFAFSQQQAQKFNAQIIERQAKNILTYEEQLGAFQSSIAAGARKGLAPQKVMELSESAAIVAKTLGLRGEQIANASRLLLGGGVNVGRSAIGRALGVSNQDISTRSGEDLEKFLKTKMRGFMDPQMQKQFATSIEGVLSTLEAKFDIFWAKVGGKFMKKIGPELEKFGKALEGPGAEKFASTIAQLFMSIFKAIETVVKSPAIPILMKFIQFLASYGDKIIIGMVLLKLAGIIGTVGAGVANFTGFLNKLGTQAAETATAIDATTAAIERNAAAAGGASMMGGVPVVTRMGGKAAATAAIAGEAGAAETALLSAAQQAAVIKMMQKGTPQAIAQARGVASGMLQQRFRTGQLTNPNYTTPYGMSPVAKGELDTWLLAQEGAVAGTGVAAAQAASLSGRAGAWMKGGGLKTAGAGLLKGAMYGGLAYTGIKMGASAVGLDKGLPGAATDALAAGAGVGLTVGMVNPIAGVIAGLIATVGKFMLNLRSMVIEADQEFKNAAKALGALRKKYPLAAHVVDLRERQTELQAMLAGKTPTILTERTLRGQLAAIPKEIKETRQKGIQAAIKKRQAENLAFVSDTTKGDIAKVLEYNKQAGEEAAGGYGFIRMLQRKYFDFATKAAEIRKNLIEGHIRLIDKDLIALAKQGKPIEQLQQTQAHRLIEEARQKMFDEQQGIRLQRKQALAIGDTRPIEGEYKRGRLAVQQQVLGQKEILGADYAKTLKAATANYDLMFNKPLKKIEQQIQGLSLGVDSENVLDSARLAFRAAREKIRALVEQFRRTGEGLTKEQGDKMLRQQAEQLAARTMTEQWRQAHDATGGIMGRARSEILEKEMMGRGLMAGVSQLPQTASAYKAIAGIEQQRRADMLTPGQFQEFRQKSLQQAKQDIFDRWQTAEMDKRQMRIEGAMQPLQFEQAQMQAQQAGMDKAKFLRTQLTPQGEQLEQQAQQEAARQFREEQIAKLEREGKSREYAPDWEDRVSAIKKGMQQQFRQLEINEELGKQTEQLNKVMEDQKNAVNAIKWKELSKVVDDSISGLQAITDYQNTGKNVKANKGLENTESGPGPTFQFQIGDNKITFKDIDAWMPQIKDALCKLASQTGSRG